MINEKITIRLVIIAKLCIRNVCQLFKALNDVNAFNSAVQYIPPIITKKDFIIA
jgi:hypothetical protein